MSPAEDRDDEALINAFKAGDASALEMLFRRYRRSVFGWLLHATGDRAEAEDLYQEVWLRIVRSASGYTAGGFRSWLWRIVRNGLIGDLRYYNYALPEDVILENYRKGKEKYAQD